MNNDCFNNYRLQCVERWHRFHATDPMQYCIDDLCYYAAKIENPSIHWETDHRARLGSGVKPLLKALLRLYAVSEKRADFVLGSRVDENLWIEITKGDLCKKAKGLKDGPWKHAKEVWIKAEVLQIKHKRIRGRGTKMRVRVNLAKLQELIGQIPVLKRLRKKDLIVRVPLLVPPGVDFNINSIIDVNVTSTSCRVPAADVGPVASEPACREESSHEAAQEPQLRHNVFDVPAGKKGSSIDPLQGDLALKQILLALESYFQVPVTLSHLKQIQRLRRRHGFSQMTPGRVDAFVHLASERLVDEWICNLRLDALLRRSVWRKVAAVVNRMQLEHLDVCQTHLEIFESSLARHRSFLLGDHDHFDQYVLKPMALGIEKDYLAFLPRAIKESIPITPEMLGAARSEMLRNPLFFLATAQHYPWEQFLDITPEEAADLRATAHSMLHYARFVVNLAEDYSRN